MISANIIGIDNEFVYSSKDDLFPSRTSLSSFLLEIYLSELDWYISKISGFFSFKKLFYSTNCFNNKYIDYNFILQFYLPIRMKKFLVNEPNLKSISSSKILRLKQHCLSSFPEFRIFDKSLNYVRYIDHILIGFVSSKTFSLFFYKKILNFVRSTLHFDFDNPLFYQSNDKFIFFLGFNLRFESNFKNFTANNILGKKRYLLRLLYKIEVYKRKISKDFSNRLNLELISHLNNITSDRIFNSIDKGKKFWTYVFQLEAVRSTSYGQRFLSFDRSPVVSDKIFTKIKLVSVLDYRKYLFNVYIFKTQLTVQKVIQDFTFNQISLSYPFDIFWNNFLNEYRKRCFLFYNNLYFEYSFNVFFKNHNLLSKSYTYGLNVSNNKLLDLNKSNFINKTYNKVNFSVCFEVYVPFELCINLLRSLGFLHFSKKRPVGNSLYLKFDDVFIIKSFGRIAYSFINWYRCCKNFYLIRLLVNIIRESCFLTICRKHNKSKTWAYNIYTYDLNVFGNLFVTKAFFPTRNRVLFLKRKFFPFRAKLFFDDKSFLNL